MLKMALLDCAINDNVAVLTEDGAFALFFRPHPGGFDSSRVPTPGNLPSKAKNMLMPGGQPGGGGGGVGLDAAGIDWCIIRIIQFSLIDGHDVFWRYSYSSVISMLSFVHYLNDSKAQHLTSLMQVFVKGFW